MDTTGNPTPTADMSDAESHLPVGSIQPPPGVSNKGTLQSRENTSSTSTINSHHTSDRRSTKHQTKHNHNHKNHNNNNNNNNNRNEININENTLTKIGESVRQKLVAAANKIKPTTTAPRESEQTITFTKTATDTGKAKRCVRKTSRTRDP